MLVGTGTRSLLGMYRTPEIGAGVLAVADQINLIL